MKNKKFEANMEGHVPGSTYSSLQTCNITFSVKCDARIPMKAVVFLWEHSSNRPVYILQTPFMN